MNDVNCPALRTTSTPSVGTFEDITHRSTRRTLYQQSIETYMLPWRGDRWTIVTTVGDDYWTSVTTPILMRFLTHAIMSKPMNSEEVNEKQQILCCSFSRTYTHKDNNLCTL